MPSGADQIHAALEQAGRSESPRVKSVIDLVPGDRVGTPQELWYIVEGHPEVSTDESAALLVSLYVRFTDGGDGHRVWGENVEVPIQQEAPSA